LHTISDNHLFLVALLIGNATVLEWLPLVIHKLMPDWAAIIVSSIIVVIVAEIVPMSATTGPNKVKLAYLGSPLVDFFIKVYYILAYPIARGLDKLLGVLDTSKIKRRDFLAFINDKKKVIFISI
jgi:CBS domain containing-hemolysin-like protein